MDGKYQAGEPYADNEVSMTGLREDLETAGFDGLSKTLPTLIKVLTTEEQPVDDREMTVFTIKFIFDNSFANIWCRWRK